MADLVDLLLAKPGLYVGAQADPNDRSDGPPSAARINVAALPGDSGVSMDYEVLSPTAGRVHAEHAVLARSAHGLVLVTSHNHGAVTTILREAEPGYFPSAEGDSPFPMAIRLEVPEPGHLVYYWSYGRPGEEIIVRDVGDVRVVG